MKRKKGSGSSLFLMEILLNILLFSVMLSFCLQFFVKAHKLTNSTTELERAVTCCSNTANMFETGDGTLESIYSMYNNKIFVDGQLVVYLDKNFIDCPSEDAVFTMTVTLLPGDSPVKKAAVSCKKGEDVIYQITACQYRALTPIDSGGNANE